MATMAHGMVMNSEHFPFSKAMVGSVIPGERLRVAVRTVNYPDFSREYELKKRPEETIVRFPHMHDAKKHAIPSKGSSDPSSIIEALKGMLQPKKPQLAEGYERVKENRMWRS